MASPRKIVFVNNYYYHVFNRGIDRRDVFLVKKDYERALNLLNYYRYADQNLRFSHYNSLNSEARREFLENMNMHLPKVEIVAYCLMPNHFHLLLKQVSDNGISSFMSNFTNAYTRYFDTKNKRKGALFEGVFKAVFVEGIEQLLHLTRYIHLNPVIGSIVATEQLAAFPWSSAGSYLEATSNFLVSETEKKTILDLASNYKAFVYDHVSYAQELHLIKHLALEE